METTLPRLTIGQENCLVLANKVKEIHKTFLEVGSLLIDNQQNGYWGETGAGSFKDFTEMLGIGYSWATRLMNMWRVVTLQQFTESEVLEIGPSKMMLMLPHTADGKLTDDVKAIARDGTFMDLRKALGHNINDPKLSEEYITCPRCGEEFGFHQYMIKRRLIDGIQD